jgi:hypothetical protein
MHHALEAKEVNPMGGVEIRHYTFIGESSFDGLMNKGNFAVEGEQRQVVFALH